MTTMGQRNSTIRKTRQAGAAMPWSAILGYGAVLAGAAFAISWLEYRHASLLVPTEIYVVVVAVAFAGLGVWIGTRLTSTGPQHGTLDRLSRLAAHGITDREATVLDLLAEGHSNKEIARELGISPNTVKTHVARLFEKLGANRRTQALRRARELSLIT